MSAPFDFPREYGKLGNWPGSINFTQAQTLLVNAVNLKRGAKFVELEFDGGRTTVVLNWAAKQLDATIDCVAAPDNDSVLWFNRALVLHGMNRGKAQLRANVTPFACDLLVVNAGSLQKKALVNDWYAAMPSGGTMIAFGDAAALDFPNKTLAVPGVAVFVKPGKAVMDKVIDHVVSEFSKPKLMAVDNGTPLRSGGGSGKRIRKGDGADPEVHAPVVANEGS